MGTVSTLYATPTPTPSVIPVSDGSGTLNDWVDTFVNPMTTDQDLVVGGIGGTPERLGVGSIGDVLTVGSSGLIDWEPSTGGFTNPMTTSQDLIIGGLAGAPGRLGVGSLGQVLTVGSGGIVDWETPSATVIGANPTASVGLSAVNGVATTYMRSDGAPALSQAIIPTWTGAHVFEASITVGKAGGTTGFVNFKGTTSGTVTLSVADAAGTNTFKLPATAGSNTNVLATDGSGNLFWQAASAGTGTINSGTANRVAYYAATGTTISGTPAITVDATTTAVSLQTTARSSGTTAYFQVNAPADTGLTAGSEAIGVRFAAATRQHASNTTITNQREIAYELPTYSFASATGTITNAATVYISGAPAAGTNAVITNAFSLWLGSGGIGIGASGAIASISPSGTGGLTLTCSGTNQDMVLTPSGTGIVKAVSASTHMAVVADAATSSNATVALYRAGIQKQLFGNAGATNALVVGSAVDDAIIRNLASGSILFTVDNGTSIAAKIVASTGQLTLPKGIASTNTTTGTLVVTGGVGISGAVFTGAAITTGTPSGGTSGAWKFGVLVTAAVTPDITRYIQLDVGGTLYKVIIST